ncbi:pentatricopeptide repeat-containing protein At4g22760-like [Durio zibethinus]|uniref:Pentatricopeptide repeat-containing protein At4g22760-like n=1 Tax=Durio zibethinus TaxID=66656 RepID=A0A6P5YA81_DURZI|nr:pentatricopeptide repeat-containing protein At4g22760-like [Durio zibethinus]
MLVHTLKSFLSNQLTIKQAKQIHAQILISSLNHLQPLFVHRFLLSTSNYSTIAYLYVQQILYHLQKPDAFSWGCTVRFLSQHGQFEEAFSLYVKMQKLGLYPTTHAISSALRSCARTGGKMGGISIHAQVHRYGVCNCVFVQTALVDLYTKLADMDTAKRVFDEMPEKNVVSWNSILSGHLKAGNLLEARRVLDEIPKKNAISWNTILSGYAKMGNMDQMLLFFQQMPEKNLASWNTLISGYVEHGEIESARSFFDMMHQRNNVTWIIMIAGYSKCGDVKSARELFDKMRKKDLLAFNAMISCYAQNSQAKEALKLFDEMLTAGVGIQPDGVTLASVISACSQLGELRFGSWIESYINKLGIQMDDHMATALIDLYAKCGNIDKAYSLFHGLRKKDVVAYSAMILGCAINGKAVDAITLFQRMVDAHIQPNLATFSGLLTAYNHTGLVEEGYQCFNSMKDNGVVPSTDHYAIMVGLLGRAGRLEDAYKLIKSMPMKPHTGVWGALLLACSLHDNVEFGEIAAQHCFELEPGTAGYYSLLANIYASVGRWSDATRLRKNMERKKLAKVPGCSWTESA